MIFEYTMYDDQNTEKVSKYTSDRDDDGVLLEWGRSSNSW